jgi:hypothetical protein
MPRFATGSAASNALNQQHPALVVIPANAGIHGFKEIPRMPVSGLRPAGASFAGMTTAKIRTEPLRFGCHSSESWNPGIKKASGCQPPAYTLPGQATLA